MKIQCVPLDAFNRCNVQAMTINHQKDNYCAAYGALSRTFRGEVHVCSMLKLAAKENVSVLRRRRPRKVQNVVWLCKEWNLTVKPFQRKEPVIYI